jgi:CrcB protein
VFDLVHLLLIVTGGFVGGMLRFGVSGLVGRVVGERFPWGTLVVNLTGCTTMGTLTALASNRGGTFDANWFRELVLIGVVGSFTTVSSFSLQTLALARAGESLKAVLNVVLSAGGCVVAIIVGNVAATWLLG